MRLALSEVCLHLVNSISTARDPVHHLSWILLVPNRSWILLVLNWSWILDSPRAKLILDPGFSSCQIDVKTAKQQWRAPPPPKWQQPMTPAGLAPVTPVAKNWQMDKIFDQRDRRRKGDTWSIDQVPSSPIFTFPRNPKSICPIHPRPLFQLGS